MAGRHSWGVRGIADVTRTVPEGAELDVTEVHAAHADFVWATLHRMGVREADVPDVLQDVFVVVHRRRAGWDGSEHLRAWLFAICGRLVRNYRRKAFRRHERLMGEVPEPRAAGAPDPERAAVAADARRTAERLLATLSPDRRAVFVMFEVEGLSCREIADQLGIPLGTVHSRLHKARAGFAKALGRWRATRGGW